VGCGSGATGRTGWLISCVLIVRDRVRVRCVLIVDVVECYHDLCQLISTSAESRGVA